MKFRESHFLRLQDYIQSGSKDPLTEDEQEYYDTLILTIGVYRKYGRSQAVHFLMGKPFLTSRAIAARMIDESINLFYFDDTVTRQAWRNLMFEEMRNAALTILKTEGITPDDLETYRRLMESAYKFKQLDAPDPEEPDSPEERQKDIKIYELDGKRLGLPKIDRDEVASLIDNLDVKERDKERLKTDAGISPIDIDKVLDNTIAIAEDEDQ